MKVKTEIVKHCVDADSSLGFTILKDPLLSTLCVKGPVTCMSVIFLNQPQEFNPDLS